MNIILTWGGDAAESLRENIRVPSLPDNDLTLAEDLIHSVSS